jgi:hypothetical protein
MRNRRLQLVLLLFLPLARPGAHAQAALPDVVKPPSSINLGSTSFYDGFGRTQPGLTILQYFRWTHDTAINLDNGNENPNFTDPRITPLPSLTQFSVATRWHPFGGCAGFSVAVPVSYISTSFAPDSRVKLSANSFGIGDLVGGPIYQSKYFVHGEEGDLGSATPARSQFAGPYFAWRFQFLVISPNGKFNPAKNINESSGYWALAPHVAATYMFTPRLEASTRIHYQYNLQTDRIADPPPIPHLVYHSGQAGQLVYANFTGSWRFTHRFYAGANSYGLYQLTPDRTNGIKVGHARETQFYLGPGGGYDFNPANTLRVNLYLEVESHTTAAGPSLQLLYIHRF